jgi:hypothetical protein
MEHRFRTFREQSAHYFFGRPHTHAICEPIDGPAAWIGRDLPPLEDLAHVLYDDEVREIDAALEVARRASKAWRDLAPDDFPLPTLSKRIVEWREAVSDGIGFQVVRGVPVDRWSRDDAELFFWCLGLHLGSPGGQNPQDDLLGHVVDTGVSESDPMVRLYQTSSNIRFHCDVADAVGLLCLKRAKQGGHSRIASSVTVFNELVRRRPDLVERLFEPFLLDTRSEAEAVVRHFPVPPCRHADGKLRTFYHADYFRSVVRHADVPPLTRQEEELLDTWEGIANEPGIHYDMDLAPGDIQLLSNHTNVHARTGYRDHGPAGERRHLLRLWLSFESG